VHIGGKRAVGPANDHALPDVLTPTHYAPSLSACVLFKEYDGAIRKKGVLNRFFLLPVAADLDANAAMPECP
jgi:hypothetical protein